MRKKLVAGNWKMNTVLEEGIDLSQQIVGMLKGNDWIQNVDVLLIPPFVHLTEIKKTIEGSGINLGAQNAHAEEYGAYTGEISAKMLASVGAAFCLVGHSERRIYQKEEGNELLLKAKRLIEEGIRPVFCVGESLDEREAGKEKTVISDQLKDLFELSESAFSKLIIAYEPVWAIGTGKTATADQAQEMHRFIRAELAKHYQPELAEQMIILYGGSCNPQNASELFSKPDVDGGLIGGASLKAESFTDLIKIANDLS
jgi:triosephosphate isomerase